MKKNHFIFLGSNNTPIFNRFECPSDETQHNKSDSECISDFVYKNNEPINCSHNNFLEDINLLSNQTYFNVPCNYENANYMYSKKFLVTSAVLFP